MSIKLILFGQLAEVTGKQHMQIDEIQDTDSLIHKLKTDFPKLQNFKFLISVDRKIIKENTKLQTGTEVALLPPFAGG